MSPPTKMAKPTYPENVYPLYFFPSYPSSSSRIQSKISINIKTLIRPFTISNIAKIILTLLPKAKAFLLRFSKVANSRLRIPPNSIKMFLSLLDSIDIKAFVNGFIIPCLKNLTEFVGGSPRGRGYAVAQRLQLSFLWKFKYRTKKSASSSYFRFHYNWSSRSYVLPAPATILAGLHRNSYRLVKDNNKNNSYHLVASPNLDKDPSNEECHGSQLNAYLEWLEQRGGQGQDSSRTRDSSAYIMRDINMLAEKFIEEKYETFILEKQESERIFQEMMARSL